MSAMQHVVWAYQSNLEYAKKLVADLSEAQMTARPAGTTMNHPAWILGHLSMPQIWLKDMFKLPTVAPARWAEMFNYMTQPGQGPYPAKAELVAMLEQTHQMLTALAGRLTDAQLAAPVEDEEMRQYSPTAGDGLVGLMTTHESLHLGQLSAWRRAMGLPSVS